MIFFEYPHFRKPLSGRQERVEACIQALKEHEAGDREIPPLKNGGFDMF